MEKIFPPDHLMRAEGREHYIDESGGERTISGNHSGVAKDLV
jgi:hypothetical protein